MKTCLQQVCRDELRRAVRDIEALERSCRVAVVEVLCSSDVAVVEDAKRLLMQDRAVNVSTLADSLNALLRQRSRGVGNLN